MVVATTGTPANADNGIAVSVSVGQAAPDYEYLAPAVEQIKTRLGRAPEQIIVDAEGGVKDGAFLATAVNAMAPPPAGATVPRQGPAPTPPQ